jgi:hypothetical protein
MRDRRTNQVIDLSRAIHLEQQTQEWLRQRELEVASTASPPIVPSEHAPEKDKVK